MPKTVLITGASRGIGRATAIFFARVGYNVAVNYYKSKQSANELVRELGELKVDAMAFRADVSDRAQVDKMIKDACSHFGRIDVLVNNAGIAQQKLFTEISRGDWDRMFAVNVDGIFHTCQSVLAQMIARKSGKIINVSSIWGICGASCEVHYSAAKAAVIGLTKALAKELGPSNIQVNCVAPGIVNTEMNSALTQQTLDELKQDTPLERIGTPEDIASTIVFLASDKANFITGQVISPNGGFVI